MPAPVLAGDHHVAGLDVAVHQPAGVGGVERRRHLRRQAGGAHGVHVPVAADQLAQVDPVDEAHRDEELAIGFAGLVHGDHVGVLDQGRRARLTLEALAKRVVLGQLGGDQLQRHRAIERELGGPVDDPHPPRPATASIR